MRLGQFSRRVAFNSAGLALPRNPSDLGLHLWIEFGVAPIDIRAEMEHALSINPCCVIDYANRDWRIQCHHPLFLAIHSPHQIFSGPTGLLLQQDVRKAHGVGQPHTARPNAPD